MLNLLDTAIERIYGPRLPYQVLGTAPNSRILDTYICLLQTERLAAIEATASTDIVVAIGSTGDILLTSSTSIYFIGHPLLCIRTIYRSAIYTSSSLFQATNIRQQQLPLPLSAVLSAYTLQFLRARVVRIRSYRATQLGLAASRPTTDIPLLFLFLFLTFFTFFIFLQCPAYIIISRQTSSNLLSFLRSESFQQYCQSASDRRGSGGRGIYSRRRYVGSNTQEQYIARLVSTSSRYRPKQLYANNDSIKASSSLYTQGLFLLLDITAVVLVSVSVSMSVSVEQLLQSYPRATASY